jgi:hypothetical protein
MTDMTSVQNLLDKTVPLWRIGYRIEARLHIENRGALNAPFGFFLEELSLSISQELLQEMWSNAEKKQPLLCSSSKIEHCAYHFS